MSYKRRKKAQHVAQQHEYYEAPSGNEQALSKEDLWFNYQPGFPGPREVRLYSEYREPIGVLAVNPIIHDDIDWTTGGLYGQQMVVGSTGVTDPQTVDTHDFHGYMAVIRRMPDSKYGQGPVATSDHNSLLSLLYAMQESSHYFPNDVSQMDVIKAV